MSNIFTRVVLLLTLSTPALALTTTCPTSLLRVESEVYSDVLEERYIAYSSTQLAALRAFLPLGREEEPQEGARLWAYRRDLRAHFSFPLDALSLIRNERQIFATVMGGEYTQAHDLVLGGQLGFIRPMTCLEGLLFERQLQEFTAPRMESEFRAQVYVSPEGSLRVLWASNRRRDGFGAGTTYFDQQVTRQTEQGYRLTRDIHNHPFRYEPKISGPGGSLVPSGSYRRRDDGEVVGGGDLNAFEFLQAQAGLRQGIVINGFEANEIPASQFGTLRALVP